MTTLADELIAADELIIEEYQRLAGHNSQHELLGYISLTSDRKGVVLTKDKGLQEKFLGQFVDEKTTVIKAWVNYYVALRRAVDKIEGINREPMVTLEKKTIPSPESIPRDDDLPF